MKSTSKERKARLFLLTLLFIITIFVTAVCIFISGRNKKLTAKNDLSSQTTEQSTSSAESTSAPASDTASDKSSEGSSEASSEEAPKSTDTTAAQKNNSTEIKTVTPDSENPYTVLVNFYNRLPENYKPQALTAVAGTSEKLESTVASHFEEMYNAALSNGVKLTPYSCYTSLELQNQNYSNKRAYYKSMGYSDDEASKKAAEYVLPSGASEHNLGYAVDFSPANASFESTEEYKWLSKNAQNYGFILRYPENKTDITNVSFEPYHWRYVGVEDAKKIKDSGLCLEEYIGG